MFQSRFLKRIAVLLVCAGMLFTECPAVVYASEENGISAESSTDSSKAAKQTTYKIQFYGNGSTSGSTKAMKNCRYGKKYTLTANGFKRKGYTFTGWNTKADGSGTSYKNTASVKNLTQKDGGTVKLYAQWKKNKYTVTFDANGGTGTMEDVGVKYGKNVMLPLCGFVRNGYVFIGWNTKSNGKGKTYSSLSKVKNLTAKKNGTVTLYATWSKLSKNELSMAKKVVTLVNKERTSAGLKKLKTDSTLTAIAQQRAKEIAEYYSHTRPDKQSSCFTLYQTANYSYMAAGENIAAGFTSSSAVMNGWMNSAGHKANILSGSYTKIGVGCYYSNGRYYWVQNFGG